MDDETTEILALATIISYKKSLMNIIIAVDNQDEEEEDLAKKLKLFNKQKALRISGYIVNVVNKYDEKQFQQNFRLKLAAFDHLLQIVTIQLESNNSRGGRPQINVRHQLLAVIWLLETPDSYRSALICQKAPCRSASYKL